MKLTSAPARRELAGDRAEHRPLVRVARQQILPRHEPAIVLEPAAADEKRVRAGAAAQARGLEVEEDERRPRGRAGRKKRRLGRRASSRSARSPIVAGRSSAGGSTPALDDEAAARASAPFAAEEFSRSAGRAGPARAGPTRPVRRPGRPRLMDDAAKPIGERAQRRISPPRRGAASQQQIENPQRRGLRQRTGVAHRTDAARGSRSRTRTRR